MSVQELITQLMLLPGDWQVVMQSDAEGNGYSPCAGLDQALYAAETTWSGTAYRQDDDDKPDDAKPCAILYPVN